MRLLILVMCALTLRSADAQLTRFNSVDEWLESEVSKAGLTNADDKAAEDFFRKLKPIIKSARVNPKQPARVMTNSHGKPMFQRLDSRAYALNAADEWLELLKAHYQKQIFLQKVSAMKLGVSKRAMEVIQVGMDMEMVEAVFNEPGQLITKIDAVETWKWDAKGYGSVVLNFDKGKVYAIHDGILIDSGK